MATYISIHDAKTIRASTLQDHNDCSPHITFEFDGDNYETRTSVTVYLPDAEFNQRLINAINAVAADAIHNYAAVADLLEGRDDEPAF